MKSATFDFSKKILGHVYLHLKTDKWDYLRRPMTDLKNSFCFGIGQAFKNPDRWNYNSPMILLLILLNRRCELKYFGALGLCVFWATFHVNIKLRKCTSKSILHTHISAS